MPKRILNLKATINPTYYTLELEDIKLIKPFKLEMGTMLKSTSVGHRSISFAVTNGNVYGRGIACSGRSSLNVVVYNGKEALRQRISKNMFSKDPQVKRTQQMTFRNAFLVLRNAIDKHFANIDIDYNFTIIDNTKIRTGYSLCASYPTAGLLQLESLEANKQVINYSKLREFRKSSPSACLVHDNNMLLILLHKVKPKRVRKLLSELYKEDGALVWLLPITEKDGESYSGIIDLTYVIKKDPDVKRSNKKYEISVIANKIMGSYIRFESLYPQWHANTPVWQPTPTQDFGMTEQQPKVYLTKHEKILALPPFPVAIRNVTFEKAKNDCGMSLSESGVISHMTLADATKMISEWEKMLEVSDTSRYHFQNRVRSKIKFNSNVIIGGVEVTTKEFYDNSNSSMNITLHRYHSKENKKFKLLGYFNLSESAKGKIKKLKPFSVEDGFAVDLNAKRLSITEEKFCVNLARKEPVSIDIEFTTDNYTRVIETYSSLWDEIVYKLGGGISICVTELENFELPPTKRCTPNDYVFSAGVEYETGVANVKVQHTRDGYDALSTDGVVYGTAQDGGGIELKTVVMDNPNVFAYIGNFDALCKSIRKSGFKPKVAASTHIHMSINPKEKITVPKGEKTQEVNPTWFGEGMFRRTLIGNNWFALLNKYLLALTFLDAFNPGGRRATTYGMGFKIIKSSTTGVNKLIYTDEIYTRFKGKQYKDIAFHTGRNSLLRTAINTSDEKTNLHWEWRGTDACPSALFMGLKIEFMQAIARSAIQHAMDGTQLDIWDPVVLSELEDVANVESIFDMTDLVCRNKAKKAIEELKEWMSPYAYKGMKAWVTYVNHLREDTGTIKWFEEMEKIIVTKIGPKFFVTEKDLNTLFELNEETECYEPKNRKKHKGIYKDKIENYQRIVSEDLLVNTTGGHEAGGFFRSGNTCFKCGGYDARAIRRFNIIICHKCAKEELKMERWKVPQAKEYTPPKNQASKTKKLINEIVTKALSFGD